MKREHIKKLNQELREIEKLEGLIKFGFIGLFSSSSAPNEFEIKEDFSHGSSVCDIRKRMYETVVSGIAELEEKLKAEARKIIEEYGY